MLDSLITAPVPLQPRRKILGMSAVLLPFLREFQLGSETGSAIDWLSYESHLQHTAAAGLVPAINMDTGFGPQLDASLRRAVLDRSVQVIGAANFIGGVFVADSPGAPFDLDAYRQEADAVVERGGTPIFFPSYGLTQGDDSQIISRYHLLARHYDTFLAFELGEMFAPFGKIHSLEVFAGWLAIPECIGAKHSSLSRVAEWKRLQLRNERRPDFHLLTGNDLAIDMVMYGSDYLLGLSTFAPEAFAQRDRWWQEGDARFYELNDLLQYLGTFAFRRPVPAYKHSAAMFLKEAGRISCDATMAGSARRPETDRVILREILERLAMS